LFLHDTATGTTTELTDAEFGVDPPALSGDGSHIAFSSLSDLTGDNPEHDIQIFLLDLAGGTTRQLGDRDSNLAPDVSVSGDGRRVAFESEADLTGDNPEGNTEVFLFDTTDGTTSQITDGTKDLSRDPSVSADGTRVAFSSRDDLTGGNPDGNEQIFFATCGSPTPSFGDVGTAHPFFAEIEWLAEVEVTGGFPDGGYHPAAPVSRQAMAAFMFRLAGEPPFDLPGTPTFDD
ncbi:hypothetical protein B7486_69690, partial [cyanobacterium TDX16]